MNTTTIESIESRLRRCVPVRAAGAGCESRLIDLALDSMDTVEFLCAIHAEFGVRLSETEFRPDQTIGELISVLAERSKSA